MTQLNNESQAAYQEIPKKGNGKRNLILISLGTFVLILSIIGVAWLQQTRSTTSVKSYLEKKYNEDFTILKGDEAEQLTRSSGAWAAYPTSDPSQTFLVVSSKDSDGYDDGRIEAKYSKVFRDQFEGRIKSIFGEDIIFGVGLGSPDSGDLVPSDLNADPKQVYATKLAHSISDFTIAIPTKEAPDVELYKEKIYQTYQLSKETNTRLPSITVIFFNRDKSDFMKDFVAEQNTPGLDYSPEHFNGTYGFVYIDKYSDVSSPEDVNTVYQEVK